MMTSAAAWQQFLIELHALGITHPRDSSLYAVVRMLIAAASLERIEESQATTQITLQNVRQELAYWSERYQQKQKEPTNGK